MFQTRKDIVLQQVLDKQDKIQKKKQLFTWTYFILIILSFLLATGECFKNEGCSPIQNIIGLLSFLIQSTAMAELKNNNKTKKRKQQIDQDHVCSLSLSHQMWMPKPIVDRVVIQKPMSHNVRWDSATPASDEDSSSQSPPAVTDTAEDIISALLSIWSDIQL